jgi:hypothetical protein
VVGAPVPTPTFEERAMSDAANVEEPDTRLLSAATGPLAPETSASGTGTVRWYRRRSTRAGGAALLVIALLLALLLLNDASPPPVKSASRAAPKVAPRPGLEIAGQGATQLPPGGVDSSWFTFPAIGAIPNGNAPQVSGGAFPFAFYIPGALSGPVTVPVEIPASPAPAGGL